MCRRWANTGQGVVVVVASARGVTSV